MHLPPLLLASLGLVGAFIGRLFFDRWFNHLSLYSLIWGTGLAFFELRLINYRPLTTEVWLVFCYAWVSFAAGSIMLILARKAVNPSTEVLSTPFSIQANLLERRLLVKLLVISSIIALAAVLQHWLVLINKFGSIAAALVSGQFIYRLRVDEQLTSMVPYLDSFGLTATYIAGVYSARIGKIKLVALIPLIIIIIGEMAEAGRARMLMGGILFFSTYFLAMVSAKPKKVLQHAGKGKRILTLGLVIVLLIVAAEFIRSYRKAFEGFYGISKELSKFEHKKFITPSIYLYFSSHVGVFNTYWKAGGEHPFPGSNTFAPVFRVLSKFGLAEDVPNYQKFYAIPIMSNTGTYLRELHADFGIFGILMTPYILGSICTLLWFYIKRKDKLIPVALLSHIYIIVCFSFLYQVTRSGGWVISLILSLIISGFIDYRSSIKDVR